MKGKTLWATGMMELLWRPPQASTEQLCVLYANSATGAGAWPLVRVQLGWSRSIEAGFPPGSRPGFLCSFFSRETEQTCLNLYICTLVKTMNYIRKLSGGFALGYNFSRLHVLFNLLTFDC